jgi:hypothetical protein
MNSELTWLPIGDSVRVECATNSARALQEPEVKQLVDKIQQYKPTRVSVTGLDVDMGQFCRLVVPHMAGVKDLSISKCSSLSAAAVVQLSAALTHHAVQLKSIYFTSQDNDDARDAIAALCIAHPSITTLIVDDLDDSRRHSVNGQPYALITALMRTPEPIGLLTIMLLQTAVPTPAGLLAMQPLDAGKVSGMDIYLTNADFPVKLRSTVPSKVLNDDLNSFAEDVRRMDALILTPHGVEEDTSEVHTYGHHLLDTEQVRLAMRYIPTVFERAYSFQPLLPQKGALEDALQENHEGKRDVTDGVFIAAVSLLGINCILDASGGTKAMLQVRRTRSRSRSPQRQ